MAILSTLPKILEYYAKLIKASSVYYRSFARRLFIITYFTLVTPLFWLHIAMTLAIFFHPPKIKYPRAITGTGIVALFLSAHSKNI
jgi:hypothetical protein